MIDGILKRQPDFDNNLLKILNGGRPDRATIFELFFSGKYINYLSQIECPGNTPFEQWPDIVRFCRQHPSVVIYCCGNELMLVAPFIEYLSDFADEVLENTDALF